MTLILSIAGAIAVIGAGWIPVRNLFRLAGKTTRFIDEVVGEPAQFGRPARPGAIQRMDSNEAAVKGVNVALQDVVVELQAQGLLLASIHHEMHPNSGLSMRDAVDRLELQAGTAADLAATVKQDLTDHAATVKTELTVQSLKVKQELDAQSQKVKTELADQSRLAQSQFDEHYAAVKTLAEAVKIAAQSTPPSND